MKTSLKKLSFGLIIIASLLVFLLKSTVAFPASVKGLRGQRYCEILLSVGKPIQRNLQVYNTIGLNDCPEYIWSKITPEIIKKETGASFVHLNGPRYWMIDGMQNSSLINPETKTLAGLAMRDAGILKLKFIDLTLADSPYKRHTVHRETTWVYLAGKPIFELADDKGNVYIMQSYSTQKATDQTEESLADLGSKLKLPKGWTFATRTLEKDAFLTPLDKNAVVIQDNNLNTYQQETPDFIAKNK